MKTDPVLKEKRETLVSERDGCLVRVECTSSRLVVSPPKPQNPDLGYVVDRLGTDRFIQEKLEARFVISIKTGASEQSVSLSLRELLQVQSAVQRLMPMNRAMVGLPQALDESW